MQTILQAAEQVPEQRHAKFRPGVSGNPRGRGLAADRAREDEAAQLELVAAIARDFGRRLTAAEAALVDEFAAASVRAKRLRRCGKPADDAVRLMARIGRMLGIIDGAAAPAKPAYDPDAFQRSIDGGRPPNSGGGAAAGASNAAPPIDLSPGPEAAPAATPRSPEGMPP